MSNNEGSIDRVIRVIIGLAMLYVGFFVMTGTWAIVGGGGGLGLVPLITGAIGFYPIYTMIGGGTNKAA
jgi:hypothetical protein